MYKLRWFNVLYAPEVINHSIERIRLSFKLIETIRLSRTVFEILPFIFQNKLKRSLDSEHAPFRDNFSSEGWDLLYDEHVHQIWSLYLKPFQRYLRGTKSLKWGMWRGHAHFIDVLLSLYRLGLTMFNPHIRLSLKCLRLPATRKWKATPNVKILVLSHPLGI